MVEKKKIAGKTLLIGAIVILGCAAAALGSTIWIQMHPVDWTAKEKTAEFELYVDDVLTANTTTITFNEILIGDSANKSLRVVNVGNVPIRLTMTVNSLPANHTLIWTDHNKLLGVDAETTGDLILTVLEGADAGPQSCSIEIRATAEG